MEINACCLISCSSFVFRFNTLQLEQITSEQITSISSLLSLSNEDQSTINSHQQPTITAQPDNLDKLLQTYAFGSYHNLMATYLTNEASGQVFNMDKIGMMDVKTINDVFSGYNKRTAPMIQGFWQLRSRNSLPFTDTCRVSSSVAKPSRRHLFCSSCSRSSRSTWMPLLELAQRKMMQKLLSHQLYLTLLPRLFCCYPTRL